MKVGRDGEITINGYKGSYWCDGNVLKLDCDDKCTAL